jgi:hypothetical protein
VAIYQLAFVRNDREAMAREVAWAAGKPGVEDVLLSNEADTAAYGGQLRKARDLSRRAAASAERAGEKEPVAEYHAQAGLRDALFGNSAKGQEGASAAMALSNGREVQFIAAMAYAIAADTNKAQGLANDLSKRLLEDTVVQLNYLPSIGAQIALNRRDRRRRLSCCNQRSNTSWARWAVVPSRRLFIRRGCEPKPIVLRVKGLKRRGSIRKSSITAVSL